MGEYNFSAIEKKWRERWEKESLYKTEDFVKGKKKLYVLVEFPYPSGAGLHVGHVRSWAAMDAFSRKKRMEGYNVLYPMGWDSLGLPAENYAIKMGVHPSKAVKENIKHFKEQCQAVGLSFDWSREIDTSDPKYYKWTQWIFLQLYKNGLAYRAETLVNWCPFCKTNLADEEVNTDGTHERCGKKTERRKQKQWLLKITAYADRLLEDLKLVDYSPRIASQQINWIDRKEWIDITYPIEGTNESVVVATTRPDTNFGATFIVLAPEHPIVEKIIKGEIKTGADMEAIRKYVEKAKNKSDLERQKEVGETKKTGIFTGLYAVNQLNNTKMPIYITDFVLMSVGTGAVVGVPGHDLRDFDFAKTFNLSIVRVVVGKDGNKSPIVKREQVQEEAGTMINSQFLDGMDIHEATRKIMDYIEEKGWGKRSIRYHLHDWIFSRQHYWGEPIPIVYCDKCGIVPLSEDQLPLVLPYVEKYQPSGTGESPLAAMTEWVNTTCHKCKGPAKRETDTMPNWAGSNWYFIRYIDIENDKGLADPEKMKYWLPVDIYQGGFEHTTLHLLYSRFIYKFLCDIGVVPGLEPYLKRRSHGIVLGADSRKISKSFGNVIDPDDIIKKYGADALRLYEAFLGPFDQMVVWNQNGLEGCVRFLDKIRGLVLKKGNAEKEDTGLVKKLYKTIKKVDDDIEELKFNTAVAAMMEFCNAWRDSDSGLQKEDAAKFLQIVSPFAPFFSEELWEKIGNKFSIHQSIWPEVDTKYLTEDEIEMVVQINGKTRTTIKVSSEQGVMSSQIEGMAKKNAAVAKYLEGKKIVKIIFVSGKLVNFVIS